MLIPGLETITVETKFTPRITFDMSKESSTDMTWWERQVQPSIRATVAGGEIAIYEPVGRPQSIFPLVAAAVGGLALVGLAFITRGIRK